MPKHSEDLSYLFDEDWDDDYDECDNLPTLGEFFWRDRYPIGYSIGEDTQKSLYVEELANQFETI